MVGFFMYSETCLNWTPNKTNFKENPNVGNLCWFNLYKPNTCLFQTQNLVPRRFCVDWFHCINKYYQCIETTLVVSKFLSRAVDRGCEQWSCETKDYKISIWCFFAKHTALRSKSKDRLSRNQDNVSEWSDTSIRWLFFQWVNTIKIQRSVLV